MEGQAHAQAYEQEVAVMIRARLRRPLLRPHQVTALSVVRGVWRVASRRSKAVTAAMTVIVAVGGIAVAGYDRLFPADKPSFTSGSAWLSSREIGHATLVNGLTAEVTASVDIRARHQPVEISQFGLTAYIARPDGSIVRIDGATLSRTTETSLEAEYDSGGILPTERDLFLVSSIGRAVSADPQRLALRSEVLAGSSGGHLAATDGRQLWVLNTTDGSLSRVGDGRDPARFAPPIGPTGPGGAILAIADGHPVVVNAVGNTAHMLSPDHGAVLKTLRLEVGEGDLLAGSPDSRHLVVVDPSAATLRWCDLDGGICHGPLPVGAPGDELSQAVSLGGHAFVGNASAGSLTIVDLSTGRALETGMLFDPPVSFELLSRGGLVFINDPDSHRAGVVRADGTVTWIQKYDPSKPPPPDDGHDETWPDPPPATDVEPDPFTGPVGPLDPSATPDPSANPNDPGTRPSPSPQPSPGASDAEPPQIIRINHSPAEPATGEEVTFTADLVGMPPETWQWTIRTFPDGVEEPAGDQSTMRHTFDAKGTYEIGLTVVHGTHTDTERTTTTVATAPPTVRCGEVITANITLHADIECEGDGLIVGADGVAIDLNGHTISSSTGSGVGIYNSLHDGVTVRDGAILQFEWGLHLDAAGATTLSNIHISDIQVGGEGAAPSSNLRVRAGRVDGWVSINPPGIAEMSFIGVTIATEGVGGITPALTSGMLFEQCSFLRAQVGYVREANGTRFIDNTFTDSYVEFADSDGVLFADNTMVGSLLTFNTMGVSRNPTIRGNTFRNTDTALHIQKPYGTVLIENNRFENNHIGVEVFDASTGELVLSGNTFTGNDIDCVGIPCS
jgi:hypothetical protein